MKTTLFTTALLAFGLPMALGLPTSPTYGDILVQRVQEPRREDATTLRAIPSRFLRVRALPPPSTTTTPTTQLTKRRHKPHWHAPDPNAHDGITYEELFIWLAEHHYDGVAHADKMELRKFMASQGVSEEDCPYGCNLDYVGDDLGPAPPY